MLMLDQIKKGSEMDRPTRRTALPAKAAGNVRVVSCRVSDRACAVVPLNVPAQVEAYDWLSYCWDMSQPRGHALPFDGVTYLMRLFNQLDAAAR